MTITSAKWRAVSATGGGGLGGFRGAMFRPGGSMADWWQLMQAPGGGFDFGPPIAGGGGTSVGPNPNQAPVDPRSLADLCCCSCKQTSPACKDVDCAAMLAFIDEMAKCYNFFNWLFAIMGLIIAVGIASMGGGWLLGLIGGALWGLFAFSAGAYTCRKGTLDEMSPAQRSCFEDCIYGCMTKGAGSASYFDEIITAIFWGALAGLLSGRGIPLGPLTGLGDTNPFEDWRRKRWVLKPQPMTF